MSALTVPAAGQGIQASWGAGVANYINDHASPIVASTAAIVNVETVVKSISVAANTLQAGSVFRVTAYGQSTSTVANAVTFRVRIGTTTLTGNIPATLTVTGTTTAAGNTFTVSGLVTIRTIGATGTTAGGMVMTESVTQPFTVLAQTSTTSSVTVNSTVANLVEFTAVTAANTTSVTFTQCVIEALKP